MPHVIWRSQSSAQLARLGFPDVPAERSRTRTERDLVSGALGAVALGGFG